VLVAGTRSQAIARPDRGEDVLLNDVVVVTPAGGLAN
jgi:hypothetical protein